MVPGERVMAGRFDKLTGASGGEAPAALASAQDAALEHHLREALIESRQRYKDLVEISSDFAWETDETGRFTFVSPKGVLGWLPEDLLGRAAVEFLAEPAESNVFAAPGPIADGAVWFRRAQGGIACLGIVAMPLKNETGRPRGARGIGRDLTAAREREEALARAQQRDRLFTHLVRAIRDEIEPEAALAAAVKATARALDATGGVVLRRVGEEQRVAAICGETAPPALLDEARAALASSEAVTFIGGAWHVIGHGARYRKAVEGAIVLWRRTEDGGFPEGDRAILSDVADQLGVAIAQVAQHEHILALSRTDPLTGLMNRRAFFEEIERRLRRLARGGRPAVLLYVDMDNFKLVNDRHGHQAGDEAIKALCRLLRGNSRGGDLAARLGGDEFALWIEGLDAAGARGRAEALLRAAAPLAELSGDPTRPLGISIGVAVVEPPQSETPEQLVARADAAMYRAKEAGKGSVAVAPAPQAGPAC